MSANSKINLPTNFLIDFINAAGKLNVEDLNSNEFRNDLIRIFNNNHLDSFDILEFLKCLLDLEWFPAKYVGVILLLLHEKCGKERPMLKLEESILLLLNHPRRKEMIYSDKESHIAMNNILNKDLQIPAFQGNDFWHKDFDVNDFIKVVNEGDVEAPSIFEKTLKDEIIEINPMRTRTYIHGEKTKRYSTYVTNRINALLLVGGLNKTDKNIAVYDQKADGLLDYSQFMVVDGTDVRTIIIDSENTFDIDNFEPLGINQIVTNPDGLLRCSLRFLSVMVTGFDVYKRSFLIQSQIDAKHSRIHQYIAEHMEKYGLFCTTAIPHLNMKLEKGFILSMTVTPLHLFAAISFNQHFWQKGVVDDIPVSDVSHRLTLFNNKKRKIEEEE
jgi:hypothetical protein